MSSVMMIRSKVKAQSVTEVEAAVQRVFAALDRERPKGIHYTSSRLADGVTYVALLALDDEVENPLPTYPEFRAFQAGLKDWLAEPPLPEPLTILGTYQP